MVFVRNFFSGPLETSLVSLRIERLCLFDVFYGENCARAIIVSSAL